MHGCTSVSVRVHARMRSRPQVLDLLARLNSEYEAGEDDDDEEEEAEAAPDDDDDNEEEGGGEGDAEQGP